MTSRPNKGFVLTIALTGIGLLIAVFALYVYLGEQAYVSPNNENPVPAYTQKSDLVLYNIGVKLDEYDPTKKRMGDFVFTSAIGPHFSKKAFLEFGAELTGPSGTDRMPHPTYFLPLGTEVFSPVAGVVENVRAQPSDYEIVIAPDGYPNWHLSLDHVVNLKVQKGDTVSVAQVLAQVGPPNSSDIPTGFGWVELQVWKTKGLLGVCPFQLLEKGVRENIERKITELAQQWETYLGQDVYKQEQWVSPGCLLETTPA